MEYSKNTFACEIMDGHIRDDQYRVMNDIIYYKERIFLVPKSKLNQKILKEVQSN